MLEMMIIVVIIGIVAAMAAPTFSLPLPGLKPEPKPGISLIW